MYTIKFLAPVLFSLCTDGLLNGQGDYCVINRPEPYKVRYYEPGKACYVQGVFYESCPKMY